MITRAFWVWLHRWVGLTMTGFLILVGLTGSLLAFNAELERLSAPQLFPGPHAGTALDPAALARRADALVPQARARTVYLGDEGSAIIGMDARPGEAPLDFNQLFLDPITGEELGRRRVGGFPNGLNNLLPFIYRLHYNLTIGLIGRWILGIVALVWTLDCFVGFYLTLPHFGGSDRRGFFARWKTAWLVKLRSSAYRVNFDFHRAFGLWLWAMLLVFAWSSVSFNLPEVYSPAMELASDYQRPDVTPLAAPKPSENRKTMDWEEAWATARKLLDDQTRMHGLTVERPIALYKLQDRGLYEYRVRSSRDISDYNGSTSIFFDAFSGELRELRLPTGQHAGNTITTWLAALHMARVFGLPYRILVCTLGLVITMLSVTGVYIWWKKRRARKLASARARATHEPGAVGAEMPAE
jgi:uncharacterized iron-regulated membrane protein